MATPPTAQIFNDALDPHEVLDFEVELFDLLEAGETVDDANWTLEVLAEGAALGLTIMTGGTRDPAMDVSLMVLKFWLTIDVAYQDDAMFDGGGVPLPLRVTAQTNSVPYRKRQRTFQVKVAQQ